VKIDSKFTPTPITNDGVGDSRAARAGRPDGAAGDSVEVQLSTLAGQLQALQGQLESGSVVDAARVAEIRQAIADGQFKVNPEVIAERLLETVRELIAADRQ